MVRYVPGAYGNRFWMRPMEPIRFLRGEASKNSQKHLPVSKAGLVQMPRGRLSFAAPDEGEKRGGDAGDNARGARFGYGMQKAADFAPAE